MAAVNHTRNKATEAMLARFARYLYARRGAGEVTVNNYIPQFADWRLCSACVRRQRPSKTHIARMHCSGASYSHICNTSLELEVYSAFLGRPIKLGRPKKPKPLVREHLRKRRLRC